MNNHRFSVHLHSFHFKKEVQMRNRLILVFFLIKCSFAQTLDADHFKNLKFRFIGPDGNRAISAAGVSSDHNTYYVGAASGGLFRTNNNGISWDPIFDDQDVSSVSALAISQKNPNILWAGTGETFIIRPAHAIGDGIYKSTDGGDTWQNMGLKKTARIAKIVIHPKNDNIVYVAALGHTFGPQKERGIYKTTNGGKTWKQILFIDENTGGIDIAINRKNPNFLIASMWEIHINTWGLNSGGESGGVFITKNGGNTWVRQDKNGLPGGKDKPVGKIAVAIAQSNPNTMYALCEENHPGLYRTNNGGENWFLVSRNHTLAERAPYYMRMAVAPDNPEKIYVLNVQFSVSEDGGKTIKSGYRAGGDNHDIWIDPEDGNRIMVAHDGCASIANDGETFKRVVLPIAQMYHAHVDDQIPYNVYGNRQDGYSYRGPSNSLERGINLGHWRAFGGCESGFGIPDPHDNNIVWSGCYDGGLEVYDVRTGHARNVRVWPEASYGWAPKDLKYRWHWTFPIHLSEHKKNTVYVGSQYVHRSTDLGQSWEVISPDLTLNLKSHQQSSGGIAIDNLMTFDGSVLFAITESPIKQGILWVGSNDGQLHLSKNSGRSWENVTKNINMPPWGTISNIEASKFDKGTAYISVDLHQMGDFDPYIYKTDNYGKSWKMISEDIPKSYSSFVHVVKEDHQVPGILYAGTDNGLYISVDDGKKWTRIKNNLPPAPVYWISLQKRFDDMVVGTYGRGIYILDDISPFREIASINGNNPSLLPIQEAYRFQSIQSMKSDGTSLIRGQNPAYGANLDFFIPNDNIKSLHISIKDGNNKEIRKIVPKKVTVGLNRVMWNLRYESTETPKLRVDPDGVDWVTYNKDGWRQLRTWDLDVNAGKLGPLAVPGKYKAVLNIDGQKLEEEFTILKDPNSSGTIKDIKEQFEFLITLRETINKNVKLINKIEELRYSLQNDYNKDPKKKAAAYKMDRKLYEIESNLFDVKLTGAREDAFRNPNKIYGRLAALGSDLTRFGADFKPTNQQVEVYQILSDRLQKQEIIFDEVMKEEFWDSEIK
tara:strand:+ start:2101 stop:5256 length:3156 start_codon:yes stop_codon:yes gene_type:complete